MSQELMTTMELAAKYRVSRCTVLRWIEAGLPCLRPSSNVVRFDPCVVESWMRERTQLAGLKPTPASEAV
jgi:phage terminase Nu1 subunit (DNA packaging protein)